MFGNFYHAVFADPVFNLLIAIYTWLAGHDFGIAIVVLTVVVKAAMWPLQTSALKSQKALQDLQPQLAVLKKKYPEKSQQEELAKETMALYTREKVNPMASCLPLFIQIPVFIALYHALGSALKSGGYEALYSFVPNPGTISPTLFGFFNLADPNIALALAAGVVQFFQAKMMVTRSQPKKVPGGGDEEMLASVNKQMMYMMPLLTVFIGWKLAAGLILYWLMMGLLTILQQWWFYRTAPTPFHEPATVAGGANQPKAPPQVGSGK